MNKNWKQKPLKELGNVVTGSTPSKKTPSYYGGNIPMVKPTQLQNKIISEASEYLTKEGAGKARLLPKGGILVTCIGEIGRTGYLTESTAFNQQINGIKFNDEIYPKYGFYYLQQPAVINYLNSKTSATTIPIINKSKFSKTIVKYPQIGKQKQIVDKIEELFSVIENSYKTLVDLPTKLDFYKHSILKAAFDKRNYKKHSRIGDIFKVVSGGTPSTKIADYWGGNISWITSANIKDNKITIEKHITSSGVENSATNIVPEGSILVVTRVGLGKVAVAPKDMCFSQDIQALLPSPEFNKEFLLYFLSYVSQSFMHKSRGTTINGITKKQLSDVMIPILTLPEQKEITENIEKQFSVVENNYSNLESLIEKINLFKQAILSKAFDGSLIN